MQQNSKKLSTFIDWPGDFQAKVKGEEYFANKKVSLVKYSEDFVFAKVKGNEIYTATLEWCESFLGQEDEQDIVCSCSCQAYERNREPCKHIWALIRNIDLESENEFFKKIFSISQDEISLATHFDFYAEVNQFIHTSEYQNEIHESLKDFDLTEEDDYAPKGSWRYNLQSLERYISDSQVDEEPTIVKKEKQTKSKIWYELETYMGLELDSGYSSLNLTLHEASQKKSGGFGKYKEKTLHPNLFYTYRGSDDEKYLNLLKGHVVSKYNRPSSEVSVPGSLSKFVLKELVQSKRLFVFGHYDTASDIPPLRLGNSVYSFSAKITKNEENWILGGVLSTRDHEVDIQEISLTTDMGYAIIDHCLYQVDLGRLRAHCEYILTHGDIHIPLDKKEELRGVIKNTIGLEQTLLDKDFGVEKKLLKGLAKINIGIDDQSNLSVIGQLKFLYDSELHNPKSKISIFNESTVNDLFYVKDQNRENEVLNFLEESPLVFNIEHLEHYTFNINMEQLNDFVRSAGEMGIEVLTQGVKVKHYHSAKNQIKSEADWFELKGSIQFDKDSPVSLPAILKHKKIDNNFIQLGDGSIGVNPETWLSKMKKLSELGLKEDNKLKFNRAQSIILDIMLEDCFLEADKNFQESVLKLRGFKGVDSVKLSKKFNGHLRDYQYSGLNWLNFLNQFSLGGCLADDMGLGKTIQVLAHLQRIKNSRSRDVFKGPSIIVVPKSLVYNWKNEANKFTPDLKVLIYEGNNRKEQLSEFDQYDIVLMTYAIMRKDISELKEFEFNYAILDEAQYIKNTSTLVAKASYLIKSKYKLVLTGTPIENHIGELFSIFRFLMPSLLPAGYSLGKIKTNEDSLKLILRGLMPFILRRTKTEVLKELPAKTESVLYCDFETKQKRIYDEMKLFYQRALTKTIKDQGLNKSKIQILEALLRMRQASCHPGLINNDHSHFPSSKLLALIENIKALVDRGEKLIVFSQFTSFLKIIQEALNDEGIGYSYLDGQTRNRENVVKEYKKDKSKNVFLISLKAGGVGLNLTEANYCFLVDPWWNPAVEAQAIDRIHRIGQKKKVFAYRIITRGSIEEKILKLQESKRNITENIMHTDDSLLKQLSKEDLQFLLN